MEQELKYKGRTIIVTLEESLDDGTLCLHISGPIGANNEVYEDKNGPRLRIYLNEYPIWENPKP
jgi:hypothetical protein